MEDKYNEIPIHEGKLAEIVKNFLAEIYFETQTNKIKIGLPKEVANRLRKEFFNSYSWIKNDFTSTNVEDEKFVAKITYPGNLKLTLEDYE